MNNNKKIEIINKIIDISENSTSVFRESPNSRYVQNKGVSFYVKSDRNYYNNIVGDILKNIESNKNFSTEYVKDFIEDLISDILKEGTNKVKDDPLLVDTFDIVFTEVSVYIPLSGIKLKKEELKIGNIKIKKITDVFYEEITKNLELLLRQNPYFFPNDKEKAIQNMVNRYEIFKGKTCAEFKMFGEESIVLEQAKKECEKSLDLLKLSSIYCYNHNTYINITLEDELAIGYQNTLIFKSNFKSYKLTNELKGHVDDFILSDIIIQNMEYFVIFILSEILEKPDKKLNDYERTLLLGVHWFANFPRQKELENQFLSLMVVLEILLTPKSESGEPIANYIAEGASIINEIGIENRKKRKIMIKRLYQKRSSIVHGSKNNQPNENDITNLKNILLTLLHWMIKYSHRFENKDELLNFIEDHKFACDILI